MKSHTGQAHHKQGKAFKVGRAENKPYEACLACANWKLEPLAELGGVCEIEVFSRCQPWGDAVYHQMRREPLEKPPAPEPAEPPPPPRRTRKPATRTKKAPPTGRLDRLASLKGGHIDVTDPDAGSPLAGLDLGGVSLPAITTDSLTTTEIALIAAYRASRRALQAERDAERAAQEEAMARHLVAWAVDLERA